MKKRLIEFAVLGIEFWLLISIYEKISNYFLIFQNQANTFYDGIVISLVASFLFLALTELNHVLSALFDRGTNFLLILYVKISDIQQRLDETIAKSYKFLMSAKTKWGPTLKNSTRKIANVDEGLLAILNYELSTPVTGVDSVERAKILDELIAEQEEEGYKSYNLGKYTTHCTAMTLFVLKRYHDVEIHQLTSEQSTNLRRTAEHLLLTGASLGWGTYNEVVNDERLIRLLSTFWALRALNVWGFSGEIKYREILSSLLNRVSDGEFGFSIGSQPKTSAISLFLILIKEINDEGTRDLISEKIKEKEIKKLVHLLIKDLNTPIETEEFLDELSGAHKKLPWTHFSFFLSLSALSEYADLLSRFSYLKVMLKVSAVLKTQFHKDGYYSNEKLNLVEEDPFTYPTAYAIIGLSDFRRSLLKQLKLPMGSFEKK